MLGVVVRCLVPRCRVGPAVVQVRHRRQGVARGPAVKAVYGQDGERVAEEPEVAWHARSTPRGRWQGSDKQRSHPEALFGPGSLPGVDYAGGRAGTEHRQPTRPHNSRPEKNPSSMKSELTPIYNEEKEVEKEDEKQYSVPHYTKINGWDQDNAEVKQLGKLLTNRKERGGSEVQVLEGVRLIRDAIKLGFTPSVIVFSRVKLLWQLGLPAALPGCRLYHLPYSSIRLWTDLSTSPGVMAALPKDQLEGVTARSPLPLTLLCDGVRHPDNLGSLVRLGAAVGARRVLCIGCTDAWGSKAVRAGAGAHLLVPVVQGVTWQEVRGLLDDPWAQVVITDLPREAVETEEPEEEQVVQLTEAETARRVAALEARLVEEGEGEEPGAALLEEFRQLPVPSSDYTGFQLEAGRREVVVVVGGETEGVSGAAYRLCHQLGGSRLHVPLRNSVNSLNVASAASVLLFRVQEALLEQEASRATESTSQ